MKKKTLVIFARPFQLNVNQKKKLNKVFNIRFYIKKKRPGPQEIINYARNADAIIAGGEEYSSNVLSALKNIKVISRVGIGIDNIDLRYTKKKGIKVLNTPDAPSNSTAEFCFSLIISAIKKINLLQYYVKKKKWNRLFHHEFSKLVIGIIGYGRVGSRLVQLLNKVGIGKILINEIDQKKISKIKSSRIRFVSKDKIFKNSHLVSLNVPLNNKTKNMINSKTLKKFKKGSILVNTSRGSIVDINDLEKFIKSKKISCAMLDVMPNEPYFGRLLNYKEVVITPHNASMSYDSRLNMQSGSVENLLNCFKLK